MSQGLRIVGTRGLKGSSGAAMKPPALEGRCTFDQRRWDQGVYEAKSTSRLTTQFFDQQRPLGAFQAIHQRPFILVAGCCECFQVELPSQHRRQQQGLPGWGGQDTHPGLDGHPHALGNPQLSHTGPVPEPILIVKFAAVHQRLANLFDEERVALGFAVDALQKFGRDLLSKEDAQELLGSLTVQPG